MTPFGRPVTGVAELREFIEEPHPHMRDKAIAVIDDQTARFLGLSTYFLLATVGADGAVDVSPRGEQPGGVVLLDERHLAFADRPGNRRIDSFQNILERPNVGLLFLVPGMRETVRVNGRATIVRDAPWLPDATPLGTVVEVDELFLHCGQSSTRGGLWTPEGWPTAAQLPTVKEIFYSQSAYWAEPLPGVTPKRPTSASPAR